MKRSLKNDKMKTYAEINEKIKKGTAVVLTAEEVSELSKTLSPKEIAEKAGEIYNQICLVAERLNKLGNTLSTVSNQYNSTVTALMGQQGLVGKVERFKDLSAKANKSMPNVELLNNDVDLTRLSLITTENEVK